MTTEDHIRTMIDYYDRRARWHDDYMRYTGAEAMEKLLQPIIAVVEPFVLDRRVLEIACGTGNWTGVLARRAKEVTALDSSRQSLAIAANKLEAYDNVTLGRCDAYRLEPTGTPFEVALAADWYSHIPKAAIGPFLAGLHRCLAPGAIVLFLDITYLVEFDREDAGCDADGNRIFRRELPDGSTAVVVKNFPSEDDLREVIAPLGVDFAFYEFKALKRWLVRYRLR